MAVPILMLCAVSSTFGRSLKTVRPIRKNNAIFVGTGHRPLRARGTDSMNKEEREHPLYRREQPSACQLLRTLGTQS